MATSIEQVSNLKTSGQLLERAERVIPGGGVYFTRSPRFGVPGMFPAFIRSASGCRIADVDGNEYIDFMCAFGPIVLGYNHPAVEEAANRQAALANGTTFMSEVMVELAEKLVHRWTVAADEIGASRFADWVVFAKNGSDVTTFATRIARQHTGRTKILVASGAYHGFDTWSVPGNAGIPDGHRADIDYFNWNDVASVDECFERNGGQIAGAIITPIKHDSTHDIELPAPAFVRTLQANLRRESALLIVDDIRAGFRLHPSGASHLGYGLEPDLVCFGKALGNGHPISAIVGREELRQSVSGVYFSATHFCAAVPMAAAVGLLDAFDSEHAFEQMTSGGQRLRDGIQGAALKAGVDVRYSGPLAIPNLLFEDDEGLRKMRRWSGLCARRGVIFHPRHNWFLSSAHGEADIDQAIEVAASSFRELS